MTYYNTLLTGYTPTHTCQVLTKPLHEYGIEFPDGNGTDYVIDYGQCEMTIRSNVTNSSWTPVTTDCLNGYAYDVPRERSFVSEVRKYHSWGEGIMADRK